MGAVLIYVVGGLATLFFLKLAIEQGEFVTGWVFEHVWRGIEIATQGRIKRRVGEPGRFRAFVLDKIKGWVGFAIGAFADPFIVIFRSWFPPEEEAEEPQENPAAQPQAEDAPRQPQRGPTDEQYREALKIIGLRDGLSREESKKMYFAAYHATKANLPGGDVEAGKKVTWAWEIILAKRKWKR